MVLVPRTGDEIELRLNSLKLEMTESYRFLSLMIDGFLSFHEHVKRVVSPARLRFNVIVRAKKGVIAVKNLLSLHNSLGRSILNYCGPVLASYCSKLAIEESYKLEKQALKQFFVFRQAKIFQIINSVNIFLIG